MRVADGHGEDAAGCLDRLAFFDLVDGAEHHRADRVLVEVEREAEDAALELEQLVDGRAGKALHARDAVGDLEDTSDALLLDVGLEALDVLAQRRGDVVGIEIELRHQMRSFS